MKLTSGLVLKQLSSTDQLDRLQASLSILQQAIDSEELPMIMEQPKKSPTQKRAYLQKLLDTLPSTELHAGLVAQLGAEPAFFEPRRLSLWLQELQSEADRYKVFYLTTAVALKAADRLQILKLLNDTTGQPLVLELAVDSSLIGGAVIRYGTQIADYSLKCRLEQFRGQWQSATAERKPVKAKSK